MGKAEGGKMEIDWKEIIVLFIALAIGCLSMPLYRTIHKLIWRIYKHDFGYRYFSPFYGPFEWHGVSVAGSTQKPLSRLKRSDIFSKGVNFHATQLSGVRIRFFTASPSIRIKAVLSHIENPPYCTKYGTVGFDVYQVKEARLTWVGTLIPDALGFIIDSSVNLANGFGDVLLCFPQYAGVRSLSIGVKKGFKIEKPQAKDFERPMIVFYGSSITQGAAASRTGTSYPFIVSEHFNADYFNFGFSASARGELELAEKIATIDMSAFIMEYDHNTETPDELRTTHWNFYQTIRASNKGIPIVLISRISGGLSCSIEDAVARKDIVEQTYLRAVEEGDSRVYFIDGMKLTEHVDRGSYLVDGKHPNDAGMKLIANAVIKQLERII